MLEGDEVGLVRAAILKELADPKSAGNTYFSNELKALLVRLER